MRPSKAAAADAGDYPEAREYALALLEMLDAPTWLSIQELARAHTAGKISYAAWQTAASKTLQVAAHQLHEELSADGYTTAPEVKPCHPPKT